MFNLDLIRWYPRSNSTKDSTKDSFNASGILKDRIRNDYIQKQLEETPTEDKTVK